MLHHILKPCVRASARMMYRTLQAYVHPTRGFREISGTSNRFETPFSTKILLVKIWNSLLLMLIIFLFRTFCYIIFNIFLYLSTRNRAAWGIKLRPFWYKEKEAFAQQWDVTLFLYRISLIVKVNIFLNVKIYIKSILISIF